MLERGITIHCSKCHFREYCKKAVGLTIKTLMRNEDIATENCLLFKVFEWQFKENKKWCLKQNE